MNRKDARQLAIATLEATNSYDLVATGAPDSFDGRSPVAVVTSASLEFNTIARAMLSATSAIQVSIYVRRDAGQEAATEDLLDDLVDAAMQALYATNMYTIDRSDAAPEGAPLRDIDGTIYRVERIPLRIDHDD